MVSLTRLSEFRVVVLDGHRHCLFGGVHWAREGDLFLVRSAARVVMGVVQGSEAREVAGCGSFVSGAGTWE